jgi:D-amino-acid oxidase
MTIKSGRKRVAVVGGGVVGLTCANELAKAFDVRVVADKFGVETDSINATAIWHVYLVPETTQVLKWAERTLARFLEIGKDHATAAIELVEGVELFRRGIGTRPSWAHIPPIFEFLSEGDLKKYNQLDDEFLTEKEKVSLLENPVLWGYRIQAPAVSMDRYLAWLEKTARDAHVAFVRRRLVSLNELASDCDAIVNCSGFGARELVGDTNFVVYKGQYFILKGDASAPRDYVGDDDHPGGMAYMIPRCGEVLIGGCAEQGVENRDLTLSFEDVIRRAGLYVPWLRTRKPSDQARAPVVGIRPSRENGVRLEIDRTSYGVPVIHNYGHGGSGFSLSWGCAESVASLLADEMLTTNGR